MLLTDSVRDGDVSAPPRWLRGVFDFADWAARCVLAVLAAGCVTILAIAAIITMIVL